MSKKIVGWEGVCYIPGDGRRDEHGRQTIMTTHTRAKREISEEAWQDAVSLGNEHQSEFIAIRPIFEDEQSARPRRIMTIAVYTTVEESVDT
jgi:hypothetical protein